MGECETFKDVLRSNISEWIRTTDLLVMSQARFHCATLNVKLLKTFLGLLPPEGIEPSTFRLEV